MQDEEAWERWLSQEEKGQKVGRYRTYRMRKYEWFEL